MELSICLPLSSSNVCSSLCIHTLIESADHKEQIRHQDAEYKAVVAVYLEKCQGSAVRANFERTTLVHLAKVEELADEKQKIIFSDASRDKLIAEVSQKCAEIQDKDIASEKAENQFILQVEQSIYKGQHEDTPDELESEKKARVSAEKEKDEIAAKLEAVLAKEAMKLEAQAERTRFMELQITRKSDVCTNILQDGQSFQSCLS
ncbi:hypothetical protein PHLCEN_2v947 [Hermanssonia centrifuga]|uniref:Uncharacterized protein n=1 Tax=Hermanssonia centrifuga TaxID=98765 RepID=A0A2R6S4J6_9APHY|nr:hypothetical protein PHLCEN_2v947 [Hermanssonia centrifuga]